MKPFLALSALVVLSACGGSKTSNYQTSCMFETSVAGSYTSRMVNGTTSEVVPVYTAGGTDAGAAALNACIRRRAAADGVTLPTGPGAG